VLDDKEVIAVEGDDLLQQELDAGDDVGVGVVGIGITGDSVVTGSFFGASGRNDSSLFFFFCCAIIIVQY
jgi:hypothetical protein